MGWKGRIKGALPRGLLNSILLSFPALYRTRLVQYETNLVPGGGIQELLEAVEQTRHISGDIIECGSSRCGASVIMANYLREQGISKTIYACDSFAGFDRVELRREREAGLTGVPDTAFTSTSLEYVRRKLARLGVDDLVVPLPGYFEETLPALEGNFALGLIDCDLQESLLFAAEAVWPRLSPGGKLLFDDYTADQFLGARIGVDLFLEQQAGSISGHRLLNRLYVAQKG